MESLWYKNAVFYELNVRAFFDSNDDGYGNLLGVVEKLDYLEELGVDCIWLLPIYPSPLKDDGYDIADYYRVMDKYGTLAHLKTLLDAAHRRGIRVITDLVLNHTSDQHPWFQAARADRNSPYRNYYVWSDTDQKYQDARIIFIDFEPSNWTWDEEAGQYYWHRFYAHQPDLNYDNPAVHEEMMKVVKFWLDLGVDGFRADAVPYLYEREGTNCENLPETHAYLKKLRSFIDRNYPDRVLLCEANQWPHDVRPYFGDGDEFHIGFHFPVMPRIFMALRKADRTPMVEILARTPPIPDSCQWCTFLRNHDELTLEMVTEEERQWMWQEYAPLDRMRLNLGIRRRLAPLLDNDRRKIELINSLLFTLPGTPIIYYGDEIGMGDDIWLPDRNGVRTPMQWEPGLNAGFSQAEADKLYLPVISDAPYDPKNVNVADQRKDPDSLWHVISNMVAIRKQHLSFGMGEMAWVPSESLALAAFWRSYHDEKVLALHNLSDLPIDVTIPVENGGSARFLDLIEAGVVLPVGQSGTLSITLQPYQYRWLLLDKR